MIQYVTKDHKFHQHGLRYHAFPPFQNTVWMRQIVLLATLVLKVDVQQFVSSVSFPHIIGHILLLEIFMISFLRLMTVHLMQWYRTATHIRAKLYMKFAITTGGCSISTFFCLYSHDMVTWHGHMTWSHEIVMHSGRVAQDALFRQPSRFKGCQRKLRLSLVLHRYLRKSHSHHEFFKGLNLFFYAKLLELQMRLFTVHSHEDAYEIFIKLCSWCNWELNLPFNICYHSASFCAQRGKPSLNVHNFIST